MRKNNLLYAYFSFIDSIRKSYINYLLSYVVGEYMFYVLVVQCDTSILEDYFSEIFQKLNCIISSIGHKTNSNYTFYVNPTDDSNK